MNPQKLGCLTPLAFISALIAVALLAITGLIGGSAMFSPGPLNAQTGPVLGGVDSHAATGHTCSACHAAPWAADRMADRCEKCHTEIKAEMADPTTLHAALLSSLGTASCSDCHIEHKGPASKLTQFDPLRYNHEAGGFSLAAHARQRDGTLFTCGDCHQKGKTSFSGAYCAECHRTMDPVKMDDHIAMVGDACMTCHDGVDRFSGFDHARTAFPLVGAHAKASCSTCHPAPRTVSDFANTHTDCYSCHQKDDPHQGQFGQDCGACHSPEGWLPAKFDHNLSAFKLEGKHAGVACKSCHADGYKGTPANCFACHEKDDAHQGQFGQQCETCHIPTGWQNIIFDHSKSAFRLDGAHLQVQCVKCHQNKVFKGTPTQCQACHGEPAYHAGLFTGQACSTCHNTSAWTPARFDGPHAFPMDHGGRQNTCRDCHQQTLAQWSCYGCHDEAGIASKHREEGIGNFTDCLGCHPTGQKEEGGGGGGGGD